MFIAVLVNVRDDTFIVTKMLFIDIFRQKGLLLLPSLVTTLKIVGWTILKFQFLLWVLLILELFRNHRRLFYKAKVKNSIK